MSRNSSSDYRKAYETAKRELADLISEQERLEKKKISLRKMIETLSGICESEQISVDPSPEAAYLLEHSSLADEIRSILKAAREWMRPNQVKAELEALGHDLGKYQNPQATIHMVLKRMVESDDIDEARLSDGKQAYRCHGLATVSRSAPTRTTTVSAKKSK